ncbi:ABC transporter ATP-binding protein/permease [Candidatus Pelagibacter sp.]|nr:ABC transporter ATP-binding protein/permease [Candidatus Pelagibacter sp.]
MKSIIKLRSLLPAYLKIKTLFAVLLMILVSISETLSIALLIPIIASIVSTKNNIQSMISDYLKFLENFSETEFILISCLFIIFVYSLKNFFLIYFLKFRSHLETDCQKYFASKLFKTYLTNPYEFHMKNNSSVLLRNITTETDNIKHVVNSTISLFAEFFILIGIMTFLLIFDFWFSIIIGSFLIIIAMLFIFFIKPRINSWGLKRLTEAGNINKKVIDILQNIKLIKLWAIEKKFLKTFETSNSLRTEMVRKLAFWNGIPKIFFEFILVIGILVFFLYSFYNGINLEEAIIYMTIYGVSAIKIIPSINLIFGSTTSIQFSNVSVNKIIDELSNKDNFPETKENLVKLKFNNKICLKNISYRYPTSKLDALNKISFDINKNSKIGIFGPSGSGKSTLVDLIMGLIKPTKGQIKVDNEIIEENKNYSWRNKIGYIQQNIFLFDDTLKNNIILNSSDNLIDDEKFKQVLSSSKISDFIDKLSNGLNTNLGEKGLKISGGQRQRIGIARALYSDPDILILDEATNQLDSKNETEILDIIFKEFRNKSIIVISHDRSIMSRCNTILNIDSGHLTLSKN